MAITLTATHTKTLLNPSTGTADKVYGSDYVSATSHSVVLTGATATRIPYVDTGGLAFTDSANLAFDGTTLSSLALSLARGAITTDQKVISASATWNASGVAFTGIKFTITDTASAAGSLAMEIVGTSSGAQQIFAVDKNGSITPGWGTSSNNTTKITSKDNGGHVGFIFTNSAGASKGSFLDQGWELINGAWLGWSSNPVTGIDAGFGRASANNIIHGGASVTSGAATSRAEINKSVTAFTDGVAKTVFTLTIPNAAHSASYLVRLTGSIGAGGAVGANEASATNCYVVTICRTAGVNAVATISAAFGAAASNVAGATTVTCTGALAAVSGAVGAVNTIDIQATITKAGGASDNHTCVATASLLNANASGITIS